MSITVLVIIIIVALTLLFVGIKIMKSCLPQIIIGLIILAELAYAALGTSSSPPVSEGEENGLISDVEARKEVVETGEGRTPSYHTIHSLVKERRALTVGYVM